ncbi:SGNH/GDSL hydrolase family protein [uncultured Flavobacterium sp.]|uniref:SGNH/GDSL hydrolase family protein n=1 Tax=uncultured Flavobacterium sp. TaxID=165435 RepID=UPI0025D0BE8F|nr:SGNH/GDSL hydrolase family protein [uncultured Flavobacterium sp.]
MQFTKKNLLFLFLIVSSFSFSQIKQSDNQFYISQGRTEKLADNSVVLISAASSITFSFTGNSCEISLQSKNEYGHHAYVSLELDGKYIGRLRVENQLKNYPIKVASNKKHTLKIFKATEASTGGVLFNGAKTKLIKTATKEKKKIEFIGNSITSGMGNDTKEIPCGQGEWFDQHNAYLAYGPVLSRDLDIDFQLSSVSGMGMYRNWNDETEPVMPNVYENLYLNNDASKPYNFNFKPDIISIALGTNDFSEGDKTKDRKPFDPKKFVSNYVNFVKMLYKHNPNVQIVLVNSPMVNGEKDKVFTDCLEKIRNSFKDGQVKPIQIFKFTAVTPHGCTSHPDAEDHKIMAKQYEPFLKKMLR